jgi:hypothetical protein
MTKKSLFFLQNHTWNQYKHEYVVLAKKALIYGTRACIYNTPQKMAGLTIVVAIYISRGAWLM